MGNDIVKTKLIEPEFDVEIKLDEAIRNILERRDFETYNVKKADIQNSDDIHFIKINHISYDREKDSTDINLIDFQQILSSLSSKTQKFVYMIESDENGINLYIGTTKDENNTFLKDTFDGIYSGSHVSNSAKSQPLDEDMKHSKAMLGVPSLKRDSDKSYKQSLEKIMFPMQGKKFRITIVAESYPLEIIQEIISNYQKIGNEIHKLTKRSLNEQKSKADTQGITLTEGSSESQTGSESKSESENYSTTDKTSDSKIGGTALAGLGLAVGVATGGPVGAIIGVGAGIISQMFFGKTETKGTSRSITTSHSRTTSTNKSTSTNESQTQTQTYGITHDEINKSAIYCEELIEKYIERFQKGLNHGMWNASLYIQADDEVTLSELEHTLKSVYSGDETYFESIRFSDDLSKSRQINLSRCPMIYFDKSLNHIVHNSFAGLSSAINTEELSILSALPNNDIDGISVSKISSFGLTQSKNIDKYKSIEIGKILNKKKPTNQNFRLSFDALNSHLFVSGITGGGKSNTIKSILKKLQDDTKIDKKVPFLVIEPAKSEYKDLLSDIEDLQIFRPGAKNDIFKFNPFVFEHGRKNHSVSLTKHVDMLKTTFSSAFPMYGPMPYILEEAIHEAYESKGWNFDAEDNPYFTDHKEADSDRRSLLFPNMKDLLLEVQSVVENAGYAQELHSNIKAALQTRIRNLTLGIKGKIFNSKHVFSSDILFEKPTIIELSNIVDDDEKSFLMGLLLNKLYQYREEKGAFKELQHLTVVEEAHRLLPNISLDKSTEEAGAKAKAVETFVNILSEIRSYGEGLIIADQIVSKLHRDVIKNTNIKIVHRTMDFEDRKIIGKSINLDEYQILDIAELKTGEAIVHNRDIHQAFMVRIDEDHTSKIDKEDMKRFYNDFISRHDSYRYEYLMEKRFFVEINKRIAVDKNTKELLQKKLLNFINSAFFHEEKMLKNFNDFIDTIDYNKDDKNPYMYAFIDIFNSLNYVSNIQYFKDIDTYIEMLRYFIRLILSYLNNDKGHIKKSRQNFINSFLHENIRVVYPSMKYYDDFSIDYTLLILENIVLDRENYELINSITDEDLTEKKSFNHKLDEITKKICGCSLAGLKFSLTAIRAEKESLDLNTIIKEDS